MPKGGWDIGVVTRYTRQAVWGLSYVIRQDGVSFHTVKQSLGSMIVVGTLKLRFEVDNPACTDR